MYPSMILSRTDKSFSNCSGPSVGDDDGAVAVDTATTMESGSTSPLPASLLTTLSGLDERLRLPMTVESGDIVGAWDTAPLVVAIALRGCVGAGQVMAVLSTLKRGYPSTGYPRCCARNAAVDPSPAIEVA